MVASVNGASPESLSTCLPVWGALAAAAAAAAAGAAALLAWCDRFGFLPRT